MAAQAPHPPGTLPPYECSQIVYRALIYPQWLRSGEVKRPAFYRREDEQGISVFPSPKYASLHLTGDIFGFVSLHVGRLRNHGLDVVPDQPTHAEIIGVPTRNKNQGGAIEIADLLRLREGRLVPPELLNQLLQ
jgi:hypothetical protein